MGEMTVDLLILIIFIF